MIRDDHLASPESEDELTARVLRLAGAREDVDPVRAQRVRTAVIEEWRTTVARRRLRRRAMIVTTGLSLAASVALAAWLWNRPGLIVPPSGDVIAQVERVSGNVKLPHPVSIRTGDVVETGDDGRLGLRSSDGASIRLDVASRVRLSSPTAIDLMAGAVYVDNARDASGIEIRTPFGSVRDVGTQFEVRVFPASMRVRVRSGVVTVDANRERMRGTSGTEITVEAGNAVTRTVSVYGTEWAWTASLAAAVPIEGRALGTVLAEICREHGWTIRYADEELSRQTSRAILHGSIDGMAGPEALSVVFAAIGPGFRHELRDGVLLITRSASRIVP